MTSAQSTAPIELRYTLTTDDLLDGIAAQMRGIRRWSVAVLVFIPLVGIGIGSVMSEVWTLPADAFPIIAVAFLAILVVAVGLGLLLYRPILRLAYRWQARLLLRGNPWLTQPIRSTITDAGIETANATAEARSSWSQYPLYVETDRSFVLLASKGLGAVALVLPKHGLVGEDPARLRAMLDTNSNRRP
jgi:hypothetical protein